ncbi:MAG TPA: 2-amino-4-hydroxy-6-hydroxymethyldihydropteridine diphosphokinase [Sphingomonadaceae bacterium]|nr:2-amino-4-hydroxy-6-hydroxymethyldihydropteridine diphosphokinase [Sphingomonadaceae bacterium]
MALSRYALALGSNRRHGRYGAPACVIAAALDALAEAGVRIVRVSSVIATPPLGPGGRAFANAAAIVESALSPPALLALLKAIEHAFGRRRGRRWGARVIDLDIILWSGGRWPPFPRRPGPGRLAVPHAAWTGRDFVLVPLAQIAGGWRDPRSGRTVRHMLGRLRPSGARRRLTVTRCINREPASHGLVAQSVEQRTFNL